MCKGYYISNNRETVRSSSESTNLVEETENNNLRRNEIYALNRQSLIEYLKLAEVPGPLELGRYQVRYQELFDNIAKVSLCIKEDYSVFNYLKETRQQVESEISLIMSVKQNMHLLSSKENQVQMIDKLYDWICSANNHLVLAKTKYENEKSRKNSLNVEMNKLLELEKLYFKFLKDFEEKI